MVTKLMMDFIVTDDGDGGNVGMEVDVDVDILDDRLTSLGMPPSLSEPHDQPYPTQPYTNQAVTISQPYKSYTIPCKFPTVSTRDGAMGRGMPCQGYCTTVQQYNI